MTAADRDELVEVLAGHGRSKWVEVDSTPGAERHRPTCTCGALLDAQAPAVSLRVHLAAVVREWLAGEVEAMAPIYYPTASDEVHETNGRRPRIGYADLRTRLSLPDATRAHRAALRTGQPRTPEEVWSARKPECRGLCDPCNGVECPPADPQGGAE